VKRELVLALLLLVSLVANAVLLWSASEVDSGEVQDLQARVDTLEEANEDLTQQVAQDNRSLQSYAAQVDTYRSRVHDLEQQLQQCPGGVAGLASLQAPAVLQTVRQVSDPPFIREEVVEEGAMINVSVEVRPGKGRVLVQTTPLMGLTFQDAANTAAFVAEEQTDMSLSASDVIFSIEARDEVPAVDGPSAGALMALLLIAALEGDDLDDNVTLTGTIDPEGNVGAISGVLLKAQAARDAGKTLLLLPRENSRIVRYETVERRMDGFTIVEQRPETLEAEATIEEEIGIEVIYVETIDDVLASTVRGG
jgi:predicted S18 family serine protease